MGDKEAAGEEKHKSLTIVICETAYGDLQTGKLRPDPLYRKSTKSV